MKKLDEEIGKVDGAAIVAIWLGDKAFDKHKEYLPKIAQALSFEKTQLAAFDGERAARTAGPSTVTRTSPRGREQGQGREVVRVRLGERYRRAPRDGRTQEGRGEEVRVRPPTSPT